MLTECVVDRLIHRHYDYCGSRVMCGIFSHEICLYDEYRNNCDSCCRLYL